MPNRPDIRVENDPVKRMRELREFCLRNAPKGFTCRGNNNPFIPSQYGWDFHIWWAGAEMWFDVREKTVTVAWSEGYFNNGRDPRERARLIFDVANFSTSLHEFWRDWTVKYWPQKPGRRIVEALAAKGVQNA